MRLSLMNGAMSEMELFRVPPFFLCIRVLPASQAVWETGQFHNRQ